MLQPMYIPARVNPNVVPSSRQLIPLGIVEQAGKSFYKFDIGDSWYKAIKFYPVSVIRSINQMSENEVNETEVVIEPGAKIVSWYAESPHDRRRAEKEIAELEAKGWTFRSMAAVGIDSDSQVGEYSVLYVKPQAAVSS